MIVTTARIQATYLGGSRRTGTYGPRGARLGYTPPTRSTPGLGTSGAAEERRHWRRTRGRRSYKLHTAAAPVEDRGRRGGSTGGGPGAARRRRWRTGAGGHQGSPQPESWTGGGADRARTRRAGVYALLDWPNLPGRVTRLLRLEWGEGRWTATVGPGRRQWRLRGAGSDGPPTKMYRYRSFYLCAVKVLGITLRDILSHRFTLSLYKEIEA